MRQDGIRSRWTAGVGMARHPAFQSFPRCLAGRHSCGCPTASRGHDALRVVGAGSGAVNQICLDRIAGPDARCWCGRRCAAVVAGAAHTNPYTPPSGDPGLLTAASPEPVPGSGRQPSAAVGSRRKHRHPAGDLLAGHQLGGCTHFTLTTKSFRASSRGDLSCEAAPGGSNARCAGPRSPGTMSACFCYVRCRPAAVPCRPLTHLAVDQDAFACSATAPSNTTPPMSSPPLLPAEGTPHCG